MILLRLISWQYLRKHKVRTMLTAAGIVLGVAVFVGMHTANQSVLAAFYKTVDRIAGATQLQITAGEPGFPEEVLERVQAVPEIRVAVPVIEAMLQTPFEGQGNMLILGVDMTGDRSLRSYDIEGKGEDIIEDPLVFLAQPDSLIVTNTFAERNRLTTGSKVPMSTMEGEKLFTVRGIMKSGGLASSFGGNLAIMDVYAAQQVFGRGRMFDRIDAAVQEGLRVEDVQRKLQAVLGPGFQVESPGARGQQFESMTRIYAMTANITSLFALYIGMFIIFNTFSIAVTQRRSEIGILRALGASRGQIRALFLAESAVIGLVGSAVGVALGILIARGMAGYVGGLMAELYGTTGQVEGLELNSRLLATAILMGTLTSVIAAFIPARNAARVDPVKALQKGRYQVLTAGENRIRRIAALAIVAASLACLLFSHSQALFYLGYLLAVTAAVLLVPTMSLWLAHLLRPMMKFIRPVEGTLAADSLIQAPRRTSGAVAALMLSLALVVSLGGLAKASYQSILEWMDVALNPDLFVTPSESLTTRTFRFPASMKQDLEAIEGVDMVQTVRSARVTVRNAPVMLVAIEVSSVAMKAKLPPVTGRPEEMYRAAANGEGVIVSENFALLHGFHFGESVSIPTPKGMLTKPIIGIVKDFSDQQGSVMMDMSVYRQYWNDETANIFRIYLTRGESETVVKDRILRKFGNLRRLLVLTNANLRAYVLRLTDQWFGLTYVQIAVAVIVAILGIVNTLTVSITDRRRELGVLQAVGGLRKQIRRTIWLEAISIGIIGLILGLALGAAQLYYSLEVSARDLAGMRLSYTYPFAIAAVLLPTMLGAAFLAAIAPAETAVRGSLVEALEYE
jgi:putative ABC transport system permease protein